jgi:hypothetical protein
MGAAGMKKKVSPADPIDKKVRVLGLKFSSIASKELEYRI